MVIIFFLREKYALHEFNGSVVCLDKVEARVDGIIVYPEG